jgi:hypothetical protein
MYCPVSEKYIWPKIATKSNNKAKRSLTENVIKKDQHNISSTPPLHLITFSVSERFALLFDFVAIFAIYDELWALRPFQMRLFPRFANAKMTGPNVFLRHRTVHEYSQAYPQPRVV